jgi:hypothetical protein
MIMLGHLRNVTAADLAPAPAVFVTAPPPVYRA